MSAFCVYGMTMTHALQLAEKQVSETGLSKEQWREAVHAAANKIFVAHAPVQVSPMFDAPQFARDWMDIACRTSQIYAPTVMVRQAKTDNRGNSVIDRRTGLPLLRWAPYRPS